MLMVITLSGIRLSGGGADRGTVAPSVSEQMPPQRQPSGIDGLRHSPLMRLLRRRTAAVEDRAEKIPTVQARVDPGSDDLGRDACHHRPPGHIMDHDCIRAHDGSRADSNRAKHLAANTKETVISDNRYLPFPAGSPYHNS